MPLMLLKLLTGHSRGLVFGWSIHFAMNLCICLSKPITRPWPNRAVVWLRVWIRPFGFKKFCVLAWFFASRGGVSSWVYSRYLVLPPGSHNVCGDICISRYTGFDWEKPRERGIFVYCQVFLRSLLGFTGCYTVIFLNTPLILWKKVFFLYFKCYFKPSSYYYATLFLICQ